VFLVGAALVEYGPETFKESAHNLIMHNQSYSSHRVGLGDLLLFKGETTRAQINQNGGIHFKELVIQSMQTQLRLIALAAVAFIILFIARTKRPVYELVHLAIIPFFCMTNPQINYYYVRVLLVLWHGSNIDKPFHKLGLMFVFGIEVATQWAFMQHWARYTVTVTTSIGMAVYLSIIVLWMGYEIIRSFNFKRPAKDSTQTLNNAHLAV
jgi:hypothetical protein